MADFLMSARTVKSGVFRDEPDKTRYLFVPPGEEPSPAHGVKQKAWADEVVKAATATIVDGVRVGDILVFVHGFNNRPPVVIERHRRLRADLEALGYTGAVVSFDWPAGDLNFAYLEDRHDAVKSALQLVTDGIQLFCTYKTPDCSINIHVLAHSMGAFVVREAFADADNSGGVIGTCNWTASQVVFIAGDVSMGSLSATDKDATSLYRHAVRFTNYFNRHDGPLALSNVKRIGVAPRTGRHGLPPDAPLGAVDVDCSAYWQNDIPPDRPMVADGSRSHSWHFGDPVFMADFFALLSGIDRASVSTRRQVGSNRFVLQTPVLPTP
jgi:hypothetical protein